MDMVDLLQHLWNATLALTAAMLLVALLRAPWRRAFGAEQACHLWWLPPLAVLASQLPHAAATAVLVHVPATLLRVSTMPQMAAVHSATGPDWRTALVVAWWLGVLTCLLSAIWRQWRFVRRLRGAERLPDADDAPPIWRAADTVTGPALIGAWKPRIVLPSDFEQRYEAGERVLILAHEALHARRRDGLACAFGVALQALFWFHPLVWWALTRLRHDQELACDAGVIRQHSRQRRGYALAMLKTQTSWQSLPVGCPWLNSHPIKERIAMLKLSTPDRARRLGGLFVAMLIAFGMSVTVYAAQQPARSAVSTYQLSMVLTRGGNTLARPTVCVRPGQVGNISMTAGDGQPAWAFDLTAVAYKQDQVQINIDGTIGGDNDKTPVKLIVRSPLGKPTSAIYKSSKPSIRMQVTPTLGCAAKPRLSERLKGVSARHAAQMIAAKAGFVLENPKALDERHVTFNFDDMSSYAALQLIAKVDGKRAVFHGKRVRFEPR